MVPGGKLIRCQSVQKWYTFIISFTDLGEVLYELREDNPGEHDPARTRASKNALLFSIAGSLAIIALTVFINLSYTPKNIWFVYPAFAVLWWPLSIFFFGKWRKGGR